jgi:hypothetical protein
MTKLKMFTAMAALFLPLAVAGCSHPQPVVYAPPPPGLSALAQRGYYDGSLAARNDITKGLPPDVQRHPKFRNPPAPPPAFEEYRHSFRDGYQQTFRGGPGPGPGPAY